MSKIKTLTEAAAMIQDGMTIAIGGNVLHRSPSAMVRELVRQGRQNLAVVKTAGAYDVDMLVRGGCVHSVDAGFISYETEYGLALYYRKAAQSGKIKVNEHACYTVMCALEAGKRNVPFMPVRGLVESDLIKANDYFTTIQDPFSGERITVVKAIRPDMAVLHVQECDEEGNAFIKGPQFDDVLMAKASRGVILTTERIISRAQIKLNQDRVVIPGFLVSAVVQVKNGAKPCSCPRLYDVDDKGLREFLSLADDKEFVSYLNGYERTDRKDV